AALFAAAPSDPVLPLETSGTDARPYVTGRVSRREPRLDQPADSTGWVEPVSTAGAVRATNGSGRAHWSLAPEETLGANRHGLDGAADGGWRGWWNPESVGAATRHTDREPVGPSRTDDPADSEAVGRETAGSGTTGSATT